MADGDAAAAIGMTTVPATEDKRLGYRAINRVLDYLAAHITSGTHPASAITSGILPLVRGGTGAADAAGARSALGISATNTPSNSSNVQADLDFIAGLANGAYNGLLSPAVYSRTLSTAYRTLSVRNDGVIGYVASSRRFKQDIADVSMSAEQVLALRLVTYRYTAAVDEFGDIAPYEVGLIAEEVDALGLNWLVDYDDDGLPFGVAYDRLALPLLAAAQTQQAQLSTLHELVEAQQERLDLLAARLELLEGNE